MSSYTLLDFEGGDGFPCIYITVVVVANDYKLK